MTDERIWVRATISLPGLSLGREALIDPGDPYMADCLARGYLQRLTAETTDADGRDPPDE